MTIREILFQVMSDIFQDFNNLTIVNLSCKEFARFSLIVFLLTFFQGIFFIIHTIDHHCSWSSLVIVVTTPDNLNRSFKRWNDR